MTWPKLPPYTIHDLDADLMAVGCALTRSQLFDRWIHAGLARRCVICRHVFWRAAGRTKYVVDGVGSPRTRSEALNCPPTDNRPLPADQKHCDRKGCRELTELQVRNMAASEPADLATTAIVVASSRALSSAVTPTLGWMSTVAEAAAAIGVEEKALFDLIERYAKGDLYGEIVSRLPASILSEFLGDRWRETALARLLRLGLVCRRLDARKSTHLDTCFHAGEGEPLTHWVVFVRSYEGKDANTGDTSFLVDQRS